MNSEHAHHQSNTLQQGLKPKSGIECVDGSLLALDAFLLTQNTMPWPRVQRKCMLSNMFVNMLYVLTYLVSYLLSSFGEDNKDANELKITTQLNFLKLTRQIPFLIKSVISFSA